MSAPQTKVDNLLQLIRDNEKVPILSDYRYGEILSDAYNAYIKIFPSAVRGKARGQSIESFGDYAARKTGLKPDSIMEYKRRYEIISGLRESKYEVVHFLGYSTLAKLASPNKPSKKEKSKVLKDAERSRIQMVKEGYSKSAIREQVNKDIIKRLTQLNKNYDKHGALKNLNTPIIDVSSDEYGFPSVAGEFPVYLEWIQMNMQRLANDLRYHEGKSPASELHQAKINYEYREMLFQIVDQLNQTMSQVNTFIAPHLIPEKSIRIKPRAV